MPPESFIHSIHPPYSARPNALGSPAAPGPRQRQPVFYCSLPSWYSPMGRCMILNPFQWRTHLDPNSLTSLLLSFNFHHSLFHLPFFRQYTSLCPPSGPIEAHIWCIFFLWRIGLHIQLSDGIEVHVGYCPLPYLNPQAYHKYPIYPST